MFYSSIAVECLRIYTAASSDIEAIASIRSLLTCMDSQDADRSKVKNFVKKSFKRHNIKHKFSIVDNSLINRIFL